MTGITGTDSRTFHFGGTVQGRKQSMFGNVACCPKSCRSCWLRLLHGRSFHIRRITLTLDSDTRDLSMTMQLLFVSRCCCTILLSSCAHLQLTSRSTSPLYCMMLVQNILSFGHSRLLAQHKALQPAPLFFRIN